MNQQLQTEMPSADTTAAYAAPQTHVEEEPRDLEAQTIPEMENALQAVGTADSYLLPLLQAEARQRKQDARNMFLMMLGWIGGMLWFMRRAMGEGGNVAASLLLMFSLMCLLMFSIIAALLHRSYRRRRALARELTKAHALENIGMVVDATRVENTQVRNEAKRALTVLLPQVKASDGELLTDAHRTRLLHFLAISPLDKGYRDVTEMFSHSAFRREVDLRLAILKAYEQVGGPKELSEVERLANAKMHWQSLGKVLPEIQKAALECLPALQARANEQRASEQLLRASSAEATTPDILLRAVNVQVESAPEQLLRASEGRAG